MKYKASVKVLGKTYKAEGSSVADAISKLKPRITKGVGLLIVEYGDKKKEKVMAAPMMSRLFSVSQLTREIAIKNAGLLFDL